MSKSNQFKLNAYVNYKGNCREAFPFYEKHLGGKITMISTFNDLPDKSHIPGENWEDKYTCKPQTICTLVSAVYRR